ncbi:MAG: AbrB/MazE/SpoVT family DNA-binding domain-containing protein [Nitrospiraceae bacterium]
MEAVLKKWGNSAAVRLPVEVVKKCKLCLNERLEISVSKERIILKRAPLSSNKYLAALLAGITDENRHDAVDCGRPVGREVL